ncbi:MAG: LPS export ABC transporter permease LptF [Psittacicella sp.]
MILFKYLIKETIKTQLAILGILFILFSAQQFIHTLYTITEGSIPSTIIFKIMGLEIVGMIEYIFPLSLFMGILFSYSKLYSDNEITIVKVSGLGYKFLLKTIFALCIITGVFAFINSFWVSPWARYETSYIVTQAKHSPEASLVNPGIFIKNDYGNNVIYIGNSTKGDIKNIYLFKDVYTSHPSTIYAKTGYFVKTSLGDQIDLTNVNDYSPKTTDFVVTNFQKYNLLIDNDSGYKPVTKVRELQFFKLFGSSYKTKYSEILWRLSLIFSVFIMAFIALPLAKVENRRSRFSKILPAVFLYLIYFLLLLVFKHMGEKGVKFLEPIIGLILTNFIFIIVAIVINLRELNFSIFFKVNKKVSG